MMLKIKHIALSAALLAASAALPQIASAQQTSPHTVYRTQPVVIQTYGQVQQPMPRRAQPRRFAQAKISYAQAKAIALRRHPGASYVNMQLRGNTYHVRLRGRGGQIIDVSVDAVTGRAR